MAILVSDSFNRANNPTGLGTADTGQVWTIETGNVGNWQISSNSALWTWDSGDPNGRATIESGSVNGITKVTQVDWSGPQNFGVGEGVIFRWVDINNYWRLVYYNFPGPDNRLRLERIYLGALTTVVDVGIVPFLSPGDTISCAYCDAIFDVYWNSDLQDTYDDSLNPQNYGTKCGLFGDSGTYFTTLSKTFNDFIVETNPACESASPSFSLSTSASPSTSGSASPSPGMPCTPPEGVAISCINSKGRLFVTLANQDNDQIAYAWHEGSERMPITSMTNWKRSLRALTLQELNIAFETDNADVNDPLIVSIHRNLRKNYARDGRTTSGSNRIDSASFGFDADNIGDMIAICGENIGGPGVDYLIGRIAAQASPSLSPSPSASISASPSTTESASPSLSPSASPSSSRSSSASPSHSPSASPSSSPSLSPSPSASPSASGSASPSSSGSASPSSSGSASPSASV